MKYGITLFASLLFQVSLFGQAPANDECATAIDLGAAPICETGDFYTNVDATTSNIGVFNVPDCWPSGNTDRDVWFSWTPTPDIEDYRITITGVDANGDPAIVAPQVAIYRGICGIDMLAPSACGSTTPGSNEVTVDFFGPDQGLTYFIRVNDGGSAGAFNVCVEERPPIYLINEGTAEACSGFLYDTGGPNGNYGPNENHTFTICPNVPNNCISMNFEFYNFEGNFSESLTIYDGDAATGNPIASLEGFEFDEDVFGAVCFQANASSGCMTLVFESDESIEFEGFSAFWECSSTPCDVPATIGVNSEATADDLALAIAGAETQLSVVGLDCPDGYYGTFTGDDSDLGLEKGILLSSGLVLDAIGPNNSPSTGVFGSSPGDNDLDSLSFLQGDSILSQDACVLELDVFANTELLVFEYIFGSEEYPEFVGENNTFNDVFAFFISGPGINGIPALDDQVNIATLNDGTPVEINSVNADVNWQFYRNNQDGQSVEYDGMTSDSLGVKKSLTARAEVTPCNTYRLKLAVADRGDGSYDSGVFVSDIRGGAPEASVNFVSGVDYLVEDCLSDIPDTLLVQLDNNKPDSVTYGINITGTATQGIDYVFPTLMDSITFAPGENEFKFPILVLSDLLTEGVETIVITFTIDFGCGASNVSSVEIELRDDLNIEVNAGADTIVYCTGNEIELTATGAEFFSWSPAEIFDNPFAANVLASPVGEQLVTVTGSLGSCVDSAQVLLIGVLPEINILGADTINACAGDTVVIFQENNVNNSNLLWTDSFNGINGTDQDSFIIVPTFDQEIEVTVELAGCTARDSVYIDFGPLSLPTVIEDTTICQGYPLQLATVNFPFQTTYAWEPAADFEDPTNPQSIIFPEAPQQTYTLISTSTNGVCADTQTVMVTTIRSDIEILNGDLVEVCVGYDSVVLSANATPVGSNIVWSPNANVLNDFGDSISVMPPISVSYVASYTANGCFQSDTVLVKVDSLPVNTDITLDPFKDPYCQGDTFFLLSPIYDVGDFSSITHMWMDAPGLQTGDSLYNGFAIAQDTSLFMRLTENGACSRLDSVQVNVVTPPPFTLTPMDTTICLGDSFDYVFEITDGSMGTLEWMPDDGTLSCTDCFTPTATPNGPTQYMITLTAEGSDCTFPISANVNIFPPTELPVQAEFIACPGDVVTPFTGTPQANVTYSVVGPGINDTDPLVSIPVTETGVYIYTAFGPCDTLTFATKVILIEPVTLTFETVDEACEGDEITFNASVDAPEGQEGFFTWSVNGVVDPMGGLASFTTTLPAGNVDITVDYTNACETISVTQTIVVTPPVSLQLNANTTICSGTSVTLNLAPNPLTTDYQWTGDNGFSSTDPAPSVSPNRTTTYTVVASSTGGCPPREETITIVVIEEYTLNEIPDQLVCPGESVTLLATTDPAGVPGDYSWLYPDGTTDNNASTTFVPETSGTYTVTFTDAQGCFPAQTQTVFVEVLEGLETPTIEVTDINGELLIPGEPVFNGETITFTAINTSSLEYTFEWVNGNGTPPNGSGATLTVVAPVPPDGQDEVFMSYDLIYTSTTGGCADTITFSIPVRRAEFKIPDLITPNNDGTNDLFQVFYNGVITDFNLLIFNRWGQVVYETADVDAGWDGSKDGEPQPMDVYIYRIQFTQNGVREERDGQFSLVR